ncbi:hypothetical protein CcaverHIS002_0108500 [Cutaneotrichosporon cavernicola]|nr:hypothetical protein CcaverHIS002_0108500 [Cutaneotrichosporon cavernicola]BEJ03670.1 hypothetical protein CcaverHIS641_0108450 [Cutaneotrichosporon cavernicola]
MATLKADGTCRKPRGKLDHDRQRREAQEAEVEARIANRQASRKRKKEKREAKREAKLAARAANSGLLNSHADLLEASEPAKGAEAGEEVGSAQEAEPAENEEDTKPRTEANNIGTPDGLFMSTGLEVGEDPSEGLIPAVLKLGKGTNMALDSTQDGIDNLITSVCQSTAYGKLLHVSDIHATEELSGGQGSGVVAHLESHLGRNSSELLPTTPPEEKSKKKKKKARNDKRKVEPTAEALPPQLFIGKAPVHLQFDDDDDEDIVEALLDIGTLAGPADSEPAVDLVLIGVDPIDLNNQVSSGPEDSDPLSPFGLTAAINGEDGGSGPELLGPIQGLDHRGKQSSFTSEEFTDLGAWTPKVASNSLELILGDASTPDLATITEPIASTITVPGSKSKSKKKKKKKTATAAAAPQEASHAGSEATQPSTSVVSSKGDGGGVPMERFVRSISAGVPARLRAADPQNSEEAHPAISSNYVQAPTQTLSNEAARTPTQSCSPPSTPASSSFAEFGSMSSPPSYKQHPSWWYPWALLKHLRRLRIRALKFVVNEENARRRRYVFTSLCPLFKLEVNGCFEHLIKQQYTMGCCDQLNHAWKLLVHTVWRAEGAFCKIEGWQQVQNVPASLRRDDLPLGGPSLKVIAATREDNDDDWAKINAVLEVKLAAGEQYLSNPRTSSCDYYYVV